MLFSSALRGSIHLVADLMRELRLPRQEVDFVHLQTIAKGGAIKMAKDITVNITNKHVIIVEEIIDSGRSLIFLRNRLMSSNPASLKILTLLDKPARRDLRCKPTTLVALSKTVM